jgi:hypothetical protein
MNGGEYKQTRDQMGYECVVIIIGRPAETRPCNRTIGGNRYFDGKGNDEAEEKEIRKKGKPRNAPIISQKRTQINDL